MKKRYAVFAVQATLTAACIVLPSSQAEAFNTGQIISSDTQNEASTASKLQFMKDAKALLQTDETAYGIELKENKELSEKHYASEMERMKAIARSHCTTENNPKDDGETDSFEAETDKIIKNTSFSDSAAAKDKENSKKETAKSAEDWDTGLDIDGLKATLSKTDKLRKQKAKYEEKQSVMQKAEIAACNTTAYNVPDGTGICNSRNRTYMGYHKVTDTASAQYSLLRSNEAWTDPSTGFRMVGDRICIAVGSGYATEIGTKINLVLGDGSILRCIMGDAKSDMHTDSSHRYQKYDGSVAEFIVDYQYFNRKTPINAVNYALGTDEMIVKVVKIGG